MNYEEVVSAVAMGVLLVFSLGLWFFAVDAQFYHAVIALGYAFAIWKSLPLFFTLLAGGSPDDPEKKIISSLLGAAISLLIYLMVMVIVDVAFFGPNPPAMILVLAVAQFASAGYRGLSGSDAVPGGKVVWGIVWTGVAFSLVFWPVFGGDFASVGKVAPQLGQLGYAIEGTVVDEVVIEGGEAVVDATQRQFSVCHNRRWAELKCSAGLYTEGAVYEAASGATTLSKCVQQMREKQCGAQTQSERVTEPLVVEAGDPVIEPFIDHVRFFVPVTNTLVNDRQGRPITMAAKNVKVNIAFRYLGTKVASASTTIDTIQNGDTANIEFERAKTYGEDKRLSKKYIFPRFEATSDISTVKIEEKLIEAQKCHQSGGSGCDSWFRERFKRTDNRLSPARVGFIADAELEPEDPNKEQGRFKLSVFSRYMKKKIGPYVNGNVLAPDREHDVTVTVSYTYSAEAAFTESSRWKSGNHLLKIWTKAAWDELSPEERRQWKTENCDPVTRDGVDIQKQRTAALTTPIVPVMYTDCGGSLFSAFEPDENPPQHDVEILASATVNKEFKEQLAKKGFKIKKASTDCSGNVEHLAGRGDRSADRTFKDGWYKRDNGVFSVNPVAVVRESVQVEGQRKTIGCKLNMTLRAQLKTTTEFHTGAGS